MKPDDEVKGAKNMRNTLAGYLAAFMIGSLLLPGCAITPGETELEPAVKDGMFHTVFATAQQEAIDSDKLILLEMWRPG